MLNDALNTSSPGLMQEQIKQQMSELAGQWLFSNVVEPADSLCATYVVQSGDILSEIAKRHKVPYQFLMRINNLSSDRSLRAGQILKAVNGPFHAVAYRSRFTMDLYLQNTYIKTYKIGLGTTDHETPAGLWRARLGGKLVKPTWTDPETGKTYHAEDPNYPLGSGWIALDGIDDKTRPIQGIAIHGTNDEVSIGTRSSRGCIRLYNGELVELFDMFEPGYSELRVMD
jgi:LysM repeat protein